MFAYTDALRTVHLTGCESVTVSSCLADNMAKGIHLDRETITEKQLVRAGGGGMWHIIVSQATDVASHIKAIITEILFLGGESMRKRPGLSLMTNPLLLRSSVKQ